MWKILSARSTNDLHDIALSTFGIISFNFFHWSTDNEIPCGKKERVLFNHNTKILSCYIFKSENNQFYKEQWWVWILKETTILNRDIPQGHTTITRLYTSRDLPRNFLLWGGEFWLCDQLLKKGYGKYCYQLACCMTNILAISKIIGGMIPPHPLFNALLCTSNNQEKYET